MFATGAGGGLEAKVKGLDRLILQDYTCSLFHAAGQPQLMALIRKEKEQQFRSADVQGRGKRCSQRLATADVLAMESVLQLVVRNAHCETNSCEGASSEPAFLQGMSLQAPPRHEGMSLTAKSRPLF